MANRDVPAVAPSCRRWGGEDRREVHARGAL